MLQLLSEIERLANDGLKTLPRPQIPAARPITCTPFSRSLLFHTNQSNNMDLFIESGGQRSTDNTCRQCRSHATGGMVPPGKGSSEDSPMAIDHDIVGGMGNFEKCEVETIRENSDTMFLTGICEGTLRKNNFYRKKISIYFVLFYYFLIKLLFYHR